MNSARAHGSKCIGCSDEFATALARRLRDLAGAIRELDDTVLYQRVAVSVTKGLACGLTSRASVEEYVLLSLGLGPNFAYRFRVREHFGQKPYDHAILSLRTNSHPNCWYRPERDIVDREWLRLLADASSTNHPELVLTDDDSVPLTMPAQLSPAYGFHLDAPYMESPDEAVQTMLQVARIEAADTIVDLGSGDGRIVIAAAQRYGCRGVGADLNPENIELSERTAEKAGVSHLVKFIREDLHDVSLAGASVVTLYLLPHVNLELRERLQRELRPGSRVVSRRFDMGDWTPDVQVGGRNDAIYCWRVRKTPAAW